MGTYKSSDAVIGLLKGQDRGGGKRRGGYNGTQKRSFDGRGVMIQE